MKTSLLIAWEMCRKKCGVYSLVIFIFLIILKLIIQNYFKKKMSEFG